MAADAIEDDLARRFRIDRPPTLLARKSSKARIGFSRMRSSRPMGGCSLAATPEEAFAFHVPLSVPFFSSLWTARQRGEVPICVSAMRSWLTSATIRSSVWISLSIRFAFTSRRLRLMRWPMKPEFAGRKDFTRRILVPAIWSCSVWRKRSPARWSNRATEPRCFPTVSRLLFPLTLCPLTEASRSENGTPAAASRRGSCDAPATSSM